MAKARVRFEEVEAEIYAIRIAESNHYSLPRTFCLQSRLLQSVSCCELLPFLVQRPTDKESQRTILELARSSGVSPFRFVLPSTTTVSSSKSFVETRNCAEEMIVTESEGTARRSWSQRGEKMIPRIRFTPCGGRKTCRYNERASMVCQCAKAGRACPRPFVYPGTLASSVFAKCYKPLPFTLRFRLKVPSVHAAARWVSLRRLAGRSAHPPSKGSDKVGRSR